MAFDHPFFGEQTVALQLSEEDFIKEIAQARTYGFLKDVEQLRRMGLARGGSLENAIIIGETGVLNGGLRYRDELVRHKILDLLGDLYLLGKPLVGTIIAYGAGHLLHVKLVKAIQRELELEELTLASSESLGAASR
ncbi:MAG: UDP-3-O-acyl-N-acetylglucosamine deacetylase, partial [Candidatus Methylomirabilales bacterium]